MFACNWSVDLFAASEATFIGQAARFFAALFTLSKLLLAFIGEHIAQFFCTIPCCRNVYL